MKKLKSKLLLADKWSVLLVAAVLIIGAPLYAWGLNPAPKNPKASESPHTTTSEQPKTSSSEEKLEADNKENVQAPPAETPDKSANNKSKNSNSSPSADSQKSEAGKKTYCFNLNRQLGEKYLREVQNLNVNQNLSKEAQRFYDNYLKEVKAAGCTPNAYRSPDIWPDLF